MALLVALATFLTLVVLTAVAYHFLTIEKREIHARMDRVFDRLEQSSVQNEQPASATSELKGWRALVRSISKYIESPKASQIEHKLIQAGIPLRGSEYYVIVGGAVLAGGILALALSGNLFLGLAGAILGYLMPGLIVTIKVDRRSKAFNDQLGDALVLVANSLRTGYSFLQSIEMVAREMPAPISVEFGRVLKEMNLGVATEDAMNNLAKRVNSDDLDMVITAVLIQRQVGGNLAEVLDNIAGTIRGRIKIKGEIKTLTAQGRISGLVVSLLPIGLGMVIYVINPEYITLLFVHPIGKMMLASAVVSQLLGIYFIKKIVNIEV